MNFFFKASFNLDSIKIINFKDDYLTDDKSVTFSVDYKYNSFPFTVIFHALDERRFSLIELDLFFEKNRFRIYDFGGKIEIYKVENDKVFSGYKNLISKGVELSDIDSYGKYTYQTIYNILKGEEYNYSTLKDELEIYRLKDSILKKLSKFKKQNMKENKLALLEEKTINKRYESYNTIGLEEINAKSVLETGILSKF